MLSNVKMHYVFHEIELKNFYCPTMEQITMMNELTCIYLREIR